MTVSRAMIHPTAVIDASARIGEDVEIGAGVFVGAHCRIGPRTKLHPRCMIHDQTQLGADNDVHPGAMLGCEPQDRSYDSANPGRLLVGDGNVFREYVTISSGVGEGKPTRIGNNCYFMACSHVGHNCVTGNGVTLANGAAMGGHARIGDGCFLSSSTAVHQFCEMGEHVMIQSSTSVSMHVPPYVIVATHNCIAGLNKVGLERSGLFDADDLLEIKAVFRLFYRGHGLRPFGKALQIAQQRSWRPAAMRFVQFVNEALAQEPPRRRGVCGSHERRRRAF